MKVVSAYGSSRKAARRVARRRNDGLEKVSKRKHVKFRSVPFRSVPGRERRARTLEALSFFLFKPDRPRKLPFDVPSRPLRHHRLHCYTFSSVIRTSELGSGSDADVTLVNAINERLAERKRERRRVKNCMENTSAACEGQSI